MVAPEPYPAAAPLRSEFFDVALFGVHAAVGHMHLHVVLELAQPFARERVVQAVRETTSAIPVLGSRYVPGWWRDHWQPMPGFSAEDAVEVIDGDPRRALDELLSRPLEPSEGWPWRVSILPGTHGQRLVVTLLHCVADGAGALAVAGELAARLARQPSVDIHGDRGFGQLLRSLGWRQLPHVLAGCLQQGAQALLLPLLNRTKLPTEQLAPQSPRRVFRTVVVGIGQGSRVREVCSRVGCSVNDVLVGALALLNASLGPGGWLGNHFTADLRRYLASPSLSVCNLSGADSVVLKREAADSLDTAAKAVALRTERMKRRAVGLPFATLPALLFGAFPHAVVRAFSAFWGRWTSLLLSRGLVVTNIGPMDRYLEPLGDNLLAASVLGPFGRGSPVPIITATGFRDQLTLQINSYDTIDAAALDRMARLLGESLGRAADGEGPASMR